MCKKENVFTIRSTSWEEEADEEKEGKKDYGMAKLVLVY